MDKWTAIMIIGCSFAVALIFFAIRGGDGPYESYNRAIWDCRSAKDYQSCIVAVNSGYVRMTNGQFNTENTEQYSDKDKNNK